VAVHYLAQCAFQMDTAFPRDAMVINPCFRDSGATSDPGDLASDLADALAGWWPSGATKELRVKLYDLEGTPPVYPAAEEIRHAGVEPPSSVCPREIAVCLSFYAVHPAPRTRGRVYVPYALTTSSDAANTPRVPTATITKVAALVPIFANLGGVDVDWIVWSRVDQAAHKVTRYFIDNEWDTIRKRGLAADLRTTGTTSG
jgi:hypothetical protein